MKNKIAWKLTGSFTAALLVFAIVVGVVFISLFRRHTIDIHREELRNRAVQIARTLSAFQVEADAGTGMNGMGFGGGIGEGHGHGMMNGMGAYLRFLDDLAMADVWLVDSNLNLTVHGMGLHSYIAYQDLPPYAEHLVAQVFAGETPFSESFSDLLNVPTLTVGAPVKLPSGEVIAALLLHSPVSGIDLAVSQGVSTLFISVTIALTLAAMLSVALSCSFTKPLERMKNTALRLADGDYSAQTGVTQKDEIGQLAGVLDSLAQRLETASQESARLEEQRRTLVANVSHELRTPVTVIRGSLEALCDGVVTEPEQLRDYYAQMLEESKGLQRLVGDLLDLSRLQNSDFAIEMQPVGLPDILEDVERSTRRLGAARGIQVELDADLPESCTVVGDYGRLRQMLMTVLDNAVKFSLDGGQVRLSAIAAPHLTVSIQNDGPGIPTEDLPYLFDRFYKSKKAGLQSGTGLGLAIAKQIATRHGIQIDAANLEPSGCVFTFHFPSP